MSSIVQAIPTFPPQLKVSHLPHFEILGCPIGDYIYCAHFIASKRLQAHKLLLQLKDVAATDPQVALTLLRLCGSICRLSYLARSTPTDLVLEPLFHGLYRFRNFCMMRHGVRPSLASTVVVSLSLYSSSAYIASVCSSGVVDSGDIDVL